MNIKNIIKVKEVCIKENDSILLNSTKWKPNYNDGEHIGDCLGPKMGV